jgi:D-3-phosphoglycerate dehydrogenase / 2-oxoglutarate reductase
MRILVAGDSFCPSSAFRAAFADLAERHEVRFIDVVDDPAWVPTTPSERKLKEQMGTPAQLIDALDGADALMVQGAGVSDAVLAASPNLRIVGCARGGPVNVDLAAASALGIPVVTSPGKNADAVAELTIAFMIMLARRMPEVMRHVEGGGEFGHDNYEGARWFGHDVAGHTLGLVGFGQIGRRVASRALAFGMSVAVFDPYVDRSVIEDAGCRAVDLPGLLAVADVLSLHARATADNRGLIGRAEVAAMKPGATFINTARDVLVDESALVEGLRSGRLAGVALDLVSPSPATGRHRLLEFPNVIIATHVGGATYETLHHGAEMLAAEVERLEAGQPLLNVANRADLPVGGVIGAA